MKTFKEFLNDKNNTNTPINEAYKSHASSFGFMASSDTGNNILDISRHPDGWLAIEVRGTGNKMVDIEPENVNKFVRDLTRWLKTLK